MQRCVALMLSIVRCPKPVIARVHGIATAAGCQLVATCDLAVAAEDARFATPGVNIGLFCSTPMVALSRNLANKHAMEMLLTGELLGAAEAWRMGLVNRVVPAAQLDAAVRELARASPRSRAVRWRSASAPTTSRPRCRSRRPTVSPRRPWCATCRPRTPRKASTPSSRSDRRAGPIADARARRHRHVMTACAVAAWRQLPDGRHRANKEIELVGFKGYRRAIARRHRCKWHFARGCFPRGKSQKTLERRCAILQCSSPGFACSGFPVARSVGKRGARQVDPYRRLNEGEAVDGAHQ
jgi:enoyl-CoA hydratase/carnithine racemase